MSITTVTAPSAMCVATIAYPDLPAAAAEATFDWAALRDWATDYGNKYADLCEVDDRRLGLLPALSAAARDQRVKYAAQSALRYVIASL